MISQTVILDEKESAAVAGGHAAVEVHELDSAVINHTSSWYWNWLQIFEQDESTRISQHPDFVFSELAGTPEANDRPTYLLKGSDAAGNSTLAVLVPKDLTAKSLGGIVAAVKFRGYRLAGNRFLGSNNEKIQKRLLKTIGQLMYRHRADFLLVEDLEVDTPLRRLFESDREDGLRMFVPIPVQKKHRIRFPDNPDEYWSQFSKNARKNFRKAFKRFGETRVVRVTEIDQVAEFLHHAHQISLNSWQSHRFGLRVANNEAELRQLIFLAEQDALRSYLLFRDDTPVAFEIGTQFNSYVNGEEAGFDQRYAEYSPGKILMYKVVEDMFAENRPEWYDFGEGDAEYKRVFGNHESISGNVWLVPPDFRSKAMIASLKVCQTLNLGARRVLEISGLKTKVRQIIRRSGPGKNL